MGAINFGIPEQEVAFIAKEMGLRTFVEGGTHKGRTAKKMCDVFSKVYTIEKSEAMLSHARETLAGLSNVTLLQGDTRDHLAEILAQNDDLLFWLDAHWCGGESYGADDECPLIEELGIIFEHDKNAVILIDDARLFVAPPPLPHKIENWPSLRDIFEATPAGWGVMVYQDVIFLYPQTVEQPLARYLQQRLSEQAGRKKKPGKLQKLLKKLGLCDC